MKRRALGRSGISVSEIGLGTMTFGSTLDEPAAQKTLDKAFDAGVDFIDVAEIYPVPPEPKWAGVSEEICGRWMSGRPRDSVVVATKVAGPSDGWFRAPVRSGKTALDRHSIGRAVEGSLRRLDTDYIDLYQVHWPDPATPIEDTLEALDRLIDEGKVRAVGCSNENTYGLMKNLWTADRLGTARYQTIQNNFSLLSRRFEDELADACRREQVSLLPYSPLAGGVLSGKYQGGAWPPNARFSYYREYDRRTQRMTQRFVNERTLASTERLSALAADCGMSPVTFSIAWTLTRDFVGSTLIGVSRIEQLDEHLAAADAAIPDDILAACDEIWKEIRYPME
ncbi:MAG: aldo/keto reductase [Deltaproteobacteria bacterium]|nr:aldo/keto reductase [Deltaproteobacteria bacterium]